MDVVKEITRFNAGRDPQRLQLKYLKMRSDPFAFLRGSCHLFYARLPRSGIFRSAPVVWSCGDLHLENFGSYKGDNRLAYFDMNDFDEAALAPASWDVVRMLTSLRIGGRSLGLTQRDAGALPEVFLRHYGAALSAGKAYWVEHPTAEGLVKHLLDDLRDRQRKDFLAARTQLKGKRRTLTVDGKKALPASSAQRAKVSSFMADFARKQERPDFYEVLDIARRIAGTGSLGLERFVILVRGKGSPDGHYLLDLKETRPSSMAPRLQTPQPVWRTEAHRVVEVQRRLQAVPMAFLQAVMLGKMPCVLKGLQPTQDRVVLDAARQSLSQIEQVVAGMARIVAWAQLRSGGRQGSATTDELMAFAQGRKWRHKLLEASALCAQQTLEDAATFAEAHDDGVFRP